MAYFNKVILVGRMCERPEPPRTLPNSGVRVVKWRMASGRSRKNAHTGQWEKDPNPLFIDCEAFTRGDNSTIIDLITQYGDKGRELLIEGRLQLDQWDDKQTGQRRQKYKIIVDNIQFVGERQQGHAAPPPRPPASGWDPEGQGGMADEGDSNSIPF